MPAWSFHTVRLPSAYWSSQDIPAEVLVFDSFSEHRLNIAGVNSLVLGFQVGSLETYFFQELFHYGLESASADVFRLFIHASRKVCNRIDCIVGEFDYHILSSHHRLILFNQRILRFGENTLEVFHRQRFKFHPDRKASL